MRSLRQMMLLQICACTESQQKGTATPQLSSGDIIDTHGHTTLCSKVSMFFPTFTRRKQGHKAVGVGRDVLEGAFIDWGSFHSTETLQQQ